MRFAKFEMLQALGTLLYPPACAICWASVPSDEYLCDACHDKAVRITPPFCAVCSEPFAGAITGPFTCANCAHRTLYFEAAVASYRSRSVVRRIVHDFKYGHHLYLKHIVARWLTAAFDDPRLRDQSFDVVVPVPLHPARQRDRGFNQAAVLAKMLSGQRSIKYLEALVRVRYTTTQTAFDRTERMENLHNAFRLRENMDVRHLRVLLIDDVLTTGATLSECARILRKAGAASVYAATAARA
jgi:ComF family protein